MSETPSAVQLSSSEMSKPQNPPKLPAKRATAPKETTTEVSAYFHGPLPAPSVLEGYEHIVSGAAERIIAMAEADAKYEREIAFAALNAEESSTRRGQWFAFIVAIFALEGVCKLPRVRHCERSEAISARKRDCFVAFSSSQ